MKALAQAARITTLSICLAAAGSAQAGVMDFLFGSSKTEAPTPRPDPTRKSWRLGDFTELRIVPSEAGAAPNNQPVAILPTLLRALLADVRLPGARGEPLFAHEELDDLLQPIAEALETAGPKEDVLLVSSARRTNGFLGAPMAVTARLFVQGGNLELIVHDTRFDFFGEYRGANKQPEFVYGSRTSAGKASIERLGAANRRADWLELPLAGLAPAALGAAPAVPAVPAAATATGAAAPAMPAAPAAANSAAAAPAAIPAAAPVAVTPAAPPAAPPRTRDASFFDEQEQRLAGIKRMRDRGLISEEEYQQKRSEILKSL